MTPSPSSPSPGDTIVVWFSCGAASAVALAETLRVYRTVCDVRAVNHPVAEEDPDNIRFMRDVENWLSVRVESNPNPKYPTASAVDVWNARRAMVFVHGAPCTVHLKKEAAQEYERANKVDWHVLGFTAEERRRHERFVLTERSNVLPVLIDAGLSKQDCADILSRAGVALPRVYAEGYPNANCIGCVKATSPTYWNHVRRTRPDVFNARAEQSRKLNVPLVRVNNQRIFLDELDPRAAGRPMKSLRFECGVFCEEYRETAVEWD